MLSPLYHLTCEPSSRSAFQSTTILLKIKLIITWTLEVLKFQYSIRFYTITVPRFRDDLYGHIVHVRERELLSLGRVPIK